MPNTYGVLRDKGRSTGWGGKGGKGYSRGSKTNPLVASLRAGEAKTAKGKAIFQKRVRRKYGDPIKGSAEVSGPRGSFTKETPVDVDAGDGVKVVGNRRTMPSVVRERYETAAKRRGFTPYGGLGPDTIGGRSHFRQWRKKDRRERGFTPRESYAERTATSGHERKPHKGYKSKLDYLMRGSFGHPLRRRVSPSRGGGAGTSGVAGGSMAGVSSGSGQNQKRRRRGRRTLRVGIM